MARKAAPKRAPYRTPLSIVPAKVWRYDGGGTLLGKNEAPPPDRRRQAAARRAAREADRNGQRERDAAQRGLAVSARAFEISDRLAGAGVEYSQLLGLVEGAGSQAWVARMKLDQIHDIAAPASIEPWDLWQQVRPIIGVMEQLVEDERKRIEAMEREAQSHKPTKAKDRESGGPVGW